MKAAEQTVQQRSEKPLTSNGFPYSSSSSRPSCLRVLRAMSFAVCFILAACSPPLVNIPPLEGDVASHNPNNSGVLAVQVTALNHVLRRWPPEGGVYAVALPEGTTEKSRQRVTEQLPVGIATPQEYDGPLPTYTVAQIYMRGPNARVDVIKPDERLGRRLVSVFQTVDISGWYAQRSKVWNIPVEQALRVTREEPEGEAVE
jgi:hypothetical protein